MRHYFQNKTLWKEWASPGYPCLWWPAEQDYLEMLISYRGFSSLFHALRCCKPVSMDSLAPWLEGVGPAASSRKEIQRDILTTHQSWTCALNKCLWLKLKHHGLTVWPVLLWQKHLLPLAKKEKGNLDTVSLGQEAAQEMLPSLTAWLWASMSSCSPVFLTDKIHTRRNVFLGRFVVIWLSQECLTQTSGAVSLGDYVVHHGAKCPY